MRIEARLEAMGLELPPALEPPPGIEFPFAWVRVRGNRAYLAARGVALSHLASLKRELGDLDRVTAWLRVFAMVNVAPDFSQTPLVTNGYSDLILELYGREVGMHARSSIGMALPLDAPVLCEAEVEIDS